MIGSAEMRDCNVPRGKTGKNSRRKKSVDFNYKCLPVLLQFLMIIKLFQKISFLTHSWHLNTHIHDENSFKKCLVDIYAHVA